MAKLTYYSNAIRPKPKKQRRIDQPDRLSDLPDEVLCHILSFLPSKEAFATSVLSTRWKSLWTMVPVIDFVNYPRTSVIDFFPMVNKIVRQRKSFRATRVRIKNFVDVCHPEHVHDWVSDAVIGNLEHLELSLWCDSMSAWPVNFFTCEKLVTLKLRGDFVLSVPPRVNLPSLKTLHLTVNSSEDNDSVARLLSGCPALEVFHVKLVDCVDKSFKICVPYLKQLSIRSINSTFTRLEINTPCLESFNIRGCHHVQDYVLGDMKNVVDANIDIQISADVDEEISGYWRETSAVFKLLEALNNVQSLCLWDFTDQKMMVDPFSMIALPQFDHLVHLQLNLAHGFMFLYLEVLLGKCPRLKELVIDKDFYNSLPYWELIHPSRTSVECLSSQLISFEHRRYNKNDLPLAAYILKRAKVLKVMKIYSDHNMYGLQPKFEMLQYVSKLPRISTECIIEFE